MSDPEQLQRLGVIPTVYSLVYPETRACFDALRRDPELSEMYERAWTRHQDPMHESLLRGWQEWSAPVVRADWERLPHGYVSAGSSEAIRDRIAAHATAAYGDGRTPRIHVFAGEYEGFSAYAQAYGCAVERHARTDYRKSLIKAKGAGDRFLISAPSSLDGNVWDGYDEFITFVRESIPDMRISVDLCYVGAVADRDYTVDVRSTNIDTVFFSLSKIFGVYYHRIGGVFCAEPALGLAGNIWFKNLLSIRFGSELMQREDVFVVARKMQSLQQRVVDQIRPICGEDVVPSDVVLLANQPAGGRPELDAIFSRGTPTRRYCLTPALDALLRESSA